MARSRRERTLLALAAVCLLLLAIVAFAPHGEGPPLSEDELIHHIRERGPGLDALVEEIVPFAKAPAGAASRKALIHALAAGPGVDPYRPAMEALEAVGRPAIPELVEALRSKDPWVRRYAAMALGRLAGAEDADAVFGLREIMEGAVPVPGGHGIREEAEAALVAIRARR